MRGVGTNYDTGFSPGGKSSRPDFDPAGVRREIQTIRRDLRCGAIRVTGGDLDRLRVAATEAAEAGLEVWFSPVPCEMAPEQLVTYFRDAAVIAQDLRRGGAGVVMVAGCEMSTFAAGFIPGDDAYERMAALASPTPELLAGMAAVPARFNSFLADVAGVARSAFSGPITYASAMWEPVDWTPFDIVSVDAYLDSANAAGYGDTLRSARREGKPLAVTEFGCCTYRGAADRGAMGWAVVDETAEPPRIAGDLRRDEGEQVRYLRRVVPILRDAMVDAAFWFTFAGYRLPHRADPRFDLDLASFGLVKITDPQSAATHGVSWEPKQVFGALAEMNARG